MTTPVSSDYLVEVRGPIVLEVGVTAVASVRVEGPLGTTVPSAATVAIYNGTTEVAAAAAADIAADGTVSFEIADSVTAGQDPSAAWWALWELTCDGLAVRQPQRIILGGFRLNCPVTTAMLHEIEPTFADGLPAGQTTWYPQIRAAWNWTLERLLSEEYDPNKVRNSDGLFPTVLAKALALAAELQASYLPNGNRLEAKARLYEAQAETEWDRKRLDTDTDDDGDVDVENAPAPNPSASTDALRQQWFGA